MNPLWTTDGKGIVFRSGREGEFGSIYWKKADGTGVVEQLLLDPGCFIAPYSWSEDGNTLALFENTVSPLSGDIGILSIEAGAGRKALPKEKHFELEPQISPDGKWIAYQSDESGQGEIYVRPFPDVVAPFSAQMELWFGTG